LPRRVRACELGLLLQISELLLFSHPSPSV
jgi:hypothetical protein